MEENEVNDLENKITLKFKGKKEGERFIEQVIMSDFVMELLGIVGFDLTPELETIFMDKMVLEEQQKDDDECEVE